MSDSTDPLNPDDQPDDPMFKRLQEVFLEKSEDIENAGRKVGLYIQHAGISMVPGMTDHGFDVQPVIVANFNVGDQAWSDRVQNHEQYTTEAEFRKMAVQMEKDKFEETKAELERRMREGKDLLGGTEEE